MSSTQSAQGDQTGVGVTGVRVIARVKAPFFTSLALFLLLLFSCKSVIAQSSVCSANSYKYDGSCASCPTGTTAVVGNVGGCVPSTGPTDTAFYLSGSLAEGVAAFSKTIATPIYTSGPFGGTSSVLTLTEAAGSYLSAAGTSSPTDLPSGVNAPWSASAWVKCEAPTTWAGLISWGTAGDNQGSASSQTAAIAVSGTGFSAISGSVSTIAGGGTGTNCGSECNNDVGTAARFSNSLEGLAVDLSGNFFVTDSGTYRIRKITPSGLVSTFAGGGSGTNCGRGCNNGQGAAARFYYPTGITCDSSGNIYVADIYNRQVRKITSSGMVSTYAGGGNIDSPCEYADGQGGSARFCYLTGIAIDSTGNIFVVDQGNQRIRKIVPSDPPMVSTFAGGGSGTNCGTYCNNGQGAAARFNNPYGIAINAMGTMYVADTGSPMIRKITPQGLVSTFAGGGSGTNCGTYCNNGQGTAARFNSIAFGITCDPSGNIYVADDGNNLIRKITPSGLVSTFAGSWLVSGDSDGIGAIESFRSPQSIYYYSGKLLVAESYRIRSITLLVTLPSCDATWHHVALSYTQSTLSAYVDGSLVGSHSMSFSLPSRSSSTLRIGYGDSSIGASSFVGSLADLRIYKRSLSLPEIISLSQPSAATFLGSNLAPMSPPFVGASSYLFSCAAGSAGPQSTLFKSTVDNSWYWYSPPSCISCTAGSWAPQGTTSCSLCPPGTYSLAGASSCLKCQAGYFGNVAGLTSPTCSGTCSSVAACPAGTAFPPPQSSSSSSLVCASGGARALPTNLGLRLWPAAHPQNVRRVDLIVAPDATVCRELNLACSDQPSVSFGDGINRYIVGTASELNMEAAEDLSCAVQ